jgi:hypothetical protein
MASQDGSLGLYRLRLRRSRSFANREQYRHRGKDPYPCGKKFPYVVRFLRLSLDGCNQDTLAGMLDVFRNRPFWIQVTPQPDTSEEGRKPPYVDLLGWYQAQLFDAHLDMPQTVSHLRYGAKVKDVVLLEDASGYDCVLGPIPTPDDTRLLMSGALPVDSSTSDVSDTGDVRQTHEEEQVRGAIRLSLLDLGFANQSGESAAFSSTGAGSQTLA